MKHNAGMHMVHSSLVVMINRNEQKYIRFEKCNLNFKTQIQIVSKLFAYSLIRSWLTLTPFQTFSVNAKETLAIYNTCSRVLRGSHLTQSITT